MDNTTNNSVSGFSVLNWVAVEHKSPQHHCPQIDYLWTGRQLYTHMNREGWKSLWTLKVQISQSCVVPNDTSNSDSSFISDITTCRSFNFQLHHACPCFNCWWSNFSNPAVWVCGNVWRHHKEPQFSSSQHHNLSKRWWNEIQQVCILKP